MVLQDILKFIEGSGEDGFIFFSLGSVITGSKLKEDVRKAFAGAFSKLKQRVLWKWETETMPDLPPNVMLKKWLPQQDVLGHPKCKAFVTHGGFHSLQEAAFHAVPLVGMPIFYDQDANIKLIENLGIGVKLEFRDLTQEVILEAILSVLQNEE